MVGLRGVDRGRVILQGFFLLIGAASFFCALQVAGRVLKFPKPKPLSLSVGERSERVTRRLVVVVVDGLSVDGADRMPYLTELRRKGASFVARTETPSYSRGGYTVLGTGAKPELSGISSNDVVGRSAVDSIFQRARDSKLKTGIVAYSWWLEIFGDAFDYASTESSWGPTDEVWKEGLGKKEGRGKEEAWRGDYRVLNERGQYQPIEGPWRDFIFREKLYDVFGNPRESSWNEDLLRGQEGRRILKEQRPDLLYVHLHSPDAWGHDSASNESDEYYRGCRDADRAIEIIAREMDFERDTLVVTADHGFTSTVRLAGHGGWEDSSSLVPMVFVGRGIRAVNGGRCMQRDLVPSLAVLLGLPFPTAIQGEVLWPALDISVEKREKDFARWAKARRQLISVYGASLGLSKERLQEMEQEPDIKRAIARFRWECWRLYLLDMVPRAVVVTALVMLLLFGLRGAGKLKVSDFLVDYGLFKGSFLGFHALYLGVYSFSVAASGPALGEAVLLFTMLSGAVSVAWSCLRWRKPVSESVERVWRSVSVGAFLQAASFFVLIGLGPTRFMSHGLILYAAIIAHAQCFIVCALGTGTVSLVLRLLRLRERGSEEPSSED